MTAKGAVAAPIVIHLGAVGSTNDAAMARLHQTDVPHFVRADVQTAGRGRRGRAWSSPTGNLYVSFATPLPSNLGDDAFSMLPLSAAVALAEAIRSESQTIRPQLKWPNDVLVDGGKTAGILLEAEAGPPRRVVIGLGVNVAFQPDLPGATHLRAHDPAIGVEGLFTSLKEHLLNTLDILFGPNGVGEIRARWLGQAVGIGHSVTVRFDQSTLKGRFVGLDPSGRLILADDAGRTTLVAAGDVFIRAPGDQPGHASN